MKYMYYVSCLSIESKRRYLLTSSLVVVRKWSRTAEAQSAVDIEFRRLPLTFYNEGNRVRAGEFGGWDLPTLRLSTELFVPTGLAKNIERRCGVRS